MRHDFKSLLRAVLTRPAPAPSTLLFRNSPRVLTPSTASAPCQLGQLHRHVGPSSCGSSVYPKAQCHWFGDQLQGPKNISSSLPISRRRHSRPSQGQGLACDHMAELEPRSSDFHPVEESSGKRTAFGFQGLVLALWPEMKHCMSLGLSVHICRMGITTPPLPQDCCVSSDSRMDRTCLKRQSPADRHCYYYSRT